VETDKETSETSPRLAKPRIRPPRLRPPGAARNSSTAQDAPSEPEIKHDRETLMAIAVRQAQIEWDGTLARGAGALSTGSGALDQMPVTWAARTEQPDGKTSPEELIAAAHASCFAMALALVLGEAETPPEHLVVNAACTLAEVDGAPQITTSQLDVRAWVAGIDQAGFERHVNAASELCPVSKALRAGVQITVHGELEHS
jgi:lipoyl-dependent peroxiredoxin